MQYRAGNVAACSTPAARHQCVPRIASIATLFLFSRFAVAHFLHCASRRVLVVAVCGHAERGLCARGAKMARGIARAGDEVATSKVRFKLQITIANQSSLLFVEARQFIFSLIGVFFALPMLQLFVHCNRPAGTLLDDQLPLRFALRSMRRSVAVNG